MFRLLIIWLLFTFSFSFGQVTEEFEPLRFNENYSYLRSDSSRSVYERIKFTPMGKKVHHSAGGELRGQFFHIVNEDWGETGKRHDRYLLHRYLLHSNLHLTNNFRTFVELQGSFALEKKFVSAVDASKVEVHQAFADYEHNKILIRLGRQELQYGSQRQVSVRELPNSRQSFDAVKVVLRSQKNSVDLFYGNYVLARPGYFDEGTGSDVKLWGMYGVKKSVALASIDLYYLGLYKKYARFDSLAGREVRHSIGTRVWKSGDRWRTDFEAVCQFGTVGNTTIRAYTVSSNSGYTFTMLAFKPELGLKMEVISGNRSYHDNTLETFNPLFPKGAYFGLAALIGPANLIDVHPSLSFNLAEGIVYAVDYDVFWRYSAADGIYTPSLMLIYPGSESRDKRIGQQYATNIDWDPSKYLSLRLQATWFKAGKFLKETGAGKDILFTGITCQIKF